MKINNKNCCENFKKKSSKKQRKYISEEVKKEIVFKEKQSKFTIKNYGEKTIYKITVDGGFIKENNIKKCDFVFIVCEKNDFYFLELKGANIRKAYEQIKSTIDFFIKKIEKIEKKNIFAIIVCSKKVTNVDLINKKLKRNFLKIGKRLSFCKSKNFIIFD
ncbi:MAG: hypothetical protein B6I24_05955 [Bacteroidetes bacterium 4572_128]|nr:MAG: hypothetical protein B6I24_05955 [Bacteroidetes bacterium 4572_128]